MAECLRISPLPLSATPAEVLAAISPSDALPPPGLAVSSPERPLAANVPGGFRTNSTLDTSDERSEVAHLTRLLGWRRPTGLYGYSQSAEYKDLYIYFDYGDKASPVNA